MNRIQACKATFLLTACALAAGMTLSTWAQGRPAGDAVARFVAHPTHCQQMLGGPEHARGDTTSPEFSAALGEVIDALRPLSAKDALDAVANRCAVTRS